MLIFWFPQKFDTFVIKIIVQRHIIILDSLLGLARFFHCDHHPAQELQLVMVWHEISQQLFTNPSFIWKYLPMFVKIAWIIFRPPPLSLIEA